MIKPILVDKLEYKKILLITRLLQILFNTQ